MRIIILADIHGNLAALNAVLDDAKTRGGIDRVWCLGDIVGYGPDPGACIETIAALSQVIVAGNHDRAATGKLNTAWFNPEAATALYWTHEQLKPDEAAWLDNLPLTREQGDWLLVHGSPTDPLLEYVISAGIAEKNLERSNFQYCLVGHSHIPVAHRQEEDGVKPISLQPGVGLVVGEMRMVVNPGSVGQPRDGDPRASYAVLDTEASMLRLQRVEYDISATQDKMMAAGLPVRLVTRLEQGQ
jgi:diadenosine tetraphosphatase ApaH/serine/threonine PP2A family protein phosphatase